MNSIDQLIEDYERRAKTASEMNDKPHTGSVMDIKRRERLTTKASLYREFARELKAAKETADKQHSEDLTTLATELNGSILNGHRQEWMDHDEA